jgi:hypothetical protein
MARVARHEVRIFPLISDAGTDTTALLDAIRDALSALGCVTELKPSAYEFRKAATRY